MSTFDYLYPREKVSWQRVCYSLTCPAMVWIPLSPPLKYICEHPYSCHCPIRKGNLPDGLTSSWEKIWDSPLPLLPCGSKKTAPKKWSLFRYDLGHFDLQLFSPQTGEQNSLQATQLMIWCYSGPHTTTQSMRCHYSGPHTTTQLMVWCYSGPHTITQLMICCTTCDTKMYSK